MKHRIFGRKRVTVITDPLRRCYNGCLFSSREEWGEWFYLGTVFTEKEAEESLLSWKKLNPRNEYRQKAVEG